MVLDGFVDVIVPKGDTRLLPACIFGVSHINMVRL
jgi:hypothetical protein